MNKKIIGIFICILLIVTIVLPATGTINNEKNEKSILFNDNASMEFASAEIMVNLKKVSTFLKSLITLLNEKYSLCSFEKMFKNKKETMMGYDPPYTPNNPFPFDHATGINVDVLSSFYGGDPDSGDTVTYDIYFGTSSPPPYIYTRGPLPATQDYIGNVTSPVIPLAKGTTYYWQIIAIDNSTIHISPGPIWDFTTATDNQHPSVSITYPQNDNTIKGIITINGAASDPDGNNDLKEVLVDTGTSFQKASGTTSWSYVWDTTQVDDGEHTILAVALDKHYAQSDIDYVTVNVNNAINQPPIVDIIFPEENDNVFDIVSIHGIASDPNGNETLTKVEVKIDDKPWNTALGTKFWNYSWNTSEEINGIHKIYARSYDGENYSNYSVVNVTVLNTMPEIIIGSITGGLVISVDIKNIGTGLAEYVDWSIDVDVSFGIILSENHTEGIIKEIAADDSEQIQFYGLWGIGPITIIVQTDDAVKHATAFLLGPLVLRVA